MSNSRTGTGTYGSGSGSVLRGLGSDPVLCSFAHPYHESLHKLKKHILGSNSHKYCNCSTQLKNVPIPVDHFHVYALTSKDFSFMVKKGKHFSGKVNPLFPSMLVQPIVEVGEGSDRPSEPQPTPSPPHTSEALKEPQPSPSPQPIPSPPHQAVDLHEPVSNPTPSPLPLIPASIPQGDGGNTGDQSSNDRSLSGNDFEAPLDDAMDYETTEEDKEKDSTDLHQGTGEEKLSTDREKVSTDTQNVSTDSAKEGIDTRKVSTDTQNVSTDSAKEGTDTRKVSTNSTKLSTDKNEEATDGLNDDGSKESTPSAAQTTSPTTTTTIFGDDETIAKVLLNISQARAIEREKEKGVELRNVEDTKRPRPTSTRSILTLKPLPKIDPKDKGKKRICGKKHADLKNRKFDEIQALYEWVKRSNDRFLYGPLREVPVKADVTKQGTKKRKGGHIKMMARKRSRPQQDDEDNDELKLSLVVTPDEDKEVDYEILDRKYPIVEWKYEFITTKPRYDESKEVEELNLNVVIRSNGQRRYFSTLMRVLSVSDREDLNVIYHLVMNRYLNEAPEGFDRILWGDLMIMFNQGVHTLMTETRLVIHMLVKNKYPLKKEVLSQMLKIKLESEEDSTMALELIRFVKRQIVKLEHDNSDEDEKHKNWLVYKQTACGKDFSNPFIWLTTYKKLYGYQLTISMFVKSWLAYKIMACDKGSAKILTSPEQTATGKDMSNPFMVLMVYQKSYSSQLTMIHVLRVELVLSPPWNYTLLVAKGLTSPRANGYLVKALSNPLIADDLLKIIWLSMYHRVNTPGSDENSMKLYDLMYILSMLLKR
ncbi:hypothetical protein Tco_1568148 [Tanacetum coccineum]